MKELESRLAGLLEPVLTHAGFDLEELKVSRAGNELVVRVAVDRDGGVDLDAAAEAARAVSPVLDEHEEEIAGAYTLEVTSPGVSRPLALPRHWRRNAGRLVTATLTDGREITGRITEGAAEVATLDVAGSATMVPYADVRKAVIQVEFNRPQGGTATDELDDKTEDTIEEEDEE